MGTRSLIIAAVPGPEAQTSYCNYDSHTYELGRILSRHYATPDKVKRLMRHGDAIGIEATPERSEFFHRDRGRPMTKVFHPTIRTRWKPSLRPTTKPSSTSICSDNPNGPSCFSRSAASPSQCR